MSDVASDVARIERGSRIARAADFQRKIRASRTLPAMAARGALRALSVLYGAGATLKNVLFDVRVRRGAQCEATVVSVGNLSAGGTGKTPLVALLANAAMSSGKRVAILTRGYRRRGGAPGEGDEVKLLRRLVPGVTIVVDADRVRGASACVRAGADLILLDDGFQHRRLRRDLDIVLLDAKDPFAGGLLPLGLLREPERGLRRAAILILTRCDRAGEARVQEVRRELSRIAPDVPVLTEDHVAVGLIGHDDLIAPLAQLRGASVLAFSGIGDPQTLSESLVGLGAEVLASIDFGDHHEYSSGDRQRIHARAAEVGAAFIVTTEKDLMRYGDHRSEEPGVAARVGNDTGSSAGPVLVALRITARIRTAVERECLSVRVGFSIP